MSRFEGKSSNRSSLKDATRAQQSNTMSRRRNLEIITSTSHAESAPILRYYQSTLRGTNRPTKIPVKKPQRLRDTVGQTSAIPEIGIPGVRNILNKQYCICGKVVWGLAIMTCTAICLYQLTDRFQYYFERPITAEISVRTNISLFFPLVSLCPFIPFRNSDPINSFKEQLSQIVNKSIKSMEDIWQELPYHHDINLEMLWNMTTIDPNRMTVFPSCGFGRREEECNFSFELKHTFPTFIGNCWVIGKANDTDPVEYQGPLTGLTLKLAEPSSRYDIDAIRNYSKANKDDRALGYSIFIHDEDTSPKFDAFYRGRTIYHSVVTIMSFSIQQFIFLNTTERPCADGPTASACWIKCVEDRIIQQVPCRLPFIDYPQLPMCNGSQDYNLSYLGPRYTYLKTSKQDCNCPRRCNDLSYIHNTYTVKDPYDPNTTVVKLYFQDNVYQTMKQTDGYPWIALMSDVGGTMGLFLGMCLLSFGELLEIGVKMVRQYICRIGSKN